MSGYRPFPFAVELNVSLALIPHVEFGAQIPDDERLERLGEIAPITPDVFREVFHQAAEGNLYIGSCFADEGPHRGSRILGVGAKKMDINLADCPDAVERSRSPIGFFLERESQILQRRHLGATDGDRPRA